MSWSARDQQLVRQVFHDYLAAWNEGRDAKACAALYESDGDLLAADGVFLGSPREIERYYADRLGGSYENFRVRDIEILSLRSIQPSVAILDAKWEGYRVDEAGTPLEVVAKPMGTFVAVKKGDERRLPAVRIMIPWGPADR